MNIYSMVRCRKDPKVLYQRAGTLVTDIQSIKEGCVITLFDNRSLDYFGGNLYGNRYGDAYELYARPHIFLNIYNEIHMDHFSDLENRTYYLFQQYYVRLTEDGRYKSPYVFFDKNDFGIKKYKNGYKVQIPEIVKNNKAPSTLVFINTTYNDVDCGTFFGTILHFRGDV